MSIAEGIDVHEGGTTLTGQGVTYMRLLSLKSAMKMELESKIYVGRGIRPFNIAVREFGLEALAEIDDEDRVLNKQDIYDAICDMNEHDAVETMECYAELQKINPPKREEVIATGNADEKIFEIFNGYFKISQTKVCDLLINALEGGSNYWYFIVDSKRPFNPEDIPAQYKNHYVGECWGDGYVTFCDRDDYYGNDESIKPSEKEPNGIETWNLTEEKIMHGIELMAQNQKEFWIDFALNDYEGDGDDGDIFLQYCLFGELVYG